MKCEINVGFYWDENQQAIVDWDKRTNCPNDTTAIYHYDMPAFKGAKTYLCEIHEKVFKEWCLGKLEKL